MPVRGLLVVGSLLTVLLVPAVTAGAAVSNAPQVLKLSVTHGSTHGGTQITVSGRNFGHLRAVRLGTTLARVVGTPRATRLVVVTPRHSAGLVDLRVITRVGTSARTRVDRFRYVTPMAVSTTNLPGAVSGATYSKRLLATGGFGTRVWSATGLPAGIHLTLAGVLTGVPTAVGSSQVAVRARDQLADVAKRTLTLAVTAPVPPFAGSYTGPTSGSTLTFYVANARTSLQDVAIPQVALGCANSTAIGEPFSVASVPLAADGSFTATTTQIGQVFGAPATFTSVFQGFFHGNNAAVPFTGTFRESAIFTDTVAHSCTSNDQIFTATRQVQPIQTADAPFAGSYTGPTSGSTLTIYVANSQTSLQDVAIPQVALGCPGSTAIGEPFSVASVPLAPDGSFTSTTTQIGQVFGAPATFTYVFRGNFHSLNPDGVERAAGTFRESVIFTDTTTHSCSSNDQNFTVTRQIQPAQTADPPPAGSYTGPTSGSTLTFTVAPDGMSLQSVAIPQVALGCAGSTAIGEPFSIATVPVAADGSFTATSVQSGQVSGIPATFTLVFTGNFHSLNPNGVERAAGTFRESVTFTDTAPRSCDTNDQNFTATTT